MFKKILIVFISILLSSCSKSGNIETKQEELKFIDPIKSVFIYDEIDDEIKSKIRFANGNVALKNYQFEMINKDIYQDKLIDINGNEIYLKDYDKLIFEVVSVDCKHCQKMIEDNIDQMQEYDAKFIQYFDVGEKQDIIDFYQRIGKDIPENIVVISHSDLLRDYIKDYIKMEVYPTIIAYDEGKVSFDINGEINIDQFDRFYSLAFIDKLQIDESIINLNRSIEDVENDLSKDNLNKLLELDNDNYTRDLTLKIMGKKVDYDVLSNSKSGVFVNEIENFNEFVDKDLIVIYSYLKESDDIEKIIYVNTLIEDNKDYNFIVLLNEGLDTSSNVYKNSSVKYNARVASMSSNVPNDLLENGMAKYPSAIFIKQGVMAGAYSNIIDKKQFEKAIDLFMSNNSIALKSNN